MKIRIEFSDGYLSKTYPDVLRVRQGVSALMLYFTNGREVGIPFRVIHTWESTADDSGG